MDTLINCAGVNSPWRLTIKDHNDRKLYASFVLIGIADQVEKLLMNGLNE